MKFILDLNEETMFKYARFLGYEESELSNLNKDESFIVTITEIIENTCEDEGNDSNFIVGVYSIKINCKNYKSLRMHRKRR